MESTAFIVKALTALAQSSRLEIFRMLVVAGPAGATPGTVAQSMGVPPHTLSFHLKELTNANLVTQERSGRHVIYRVRFDRMRDVITYLTENCCGGEPCDSAASVSCPPTAKEQTDS